MRMKLLRQSRDSLKRVFDGEGDTMMLYGKGASKGYAVAPIHYFRRQRTVSEKKHTDDPSYELEKFEAARAAAIEQFSRLAKETANTLGEEKALLFEIYAMMLEDTDYVGSVEGIITEERVCAEHAVDRTAKKLARVFSESGDGYMEARAIDVCDVSERVIRIMSGSVEDFSIGEPSILAADDFSPSETVQFDREKVLGIITAGGSVNSHTAIFARTLGIPAVTGLGAGLYGIREGEMVAVNGMSGAVFPSPDESTVSFFKEANEDVFRDRKRLEEFRGSSAIAKNGWKIKLYANITSPADADSALKNDAEGIGLMRSEFLYLGMDNYPDEETQYLVYRSVVEKMKGRPVIIRTLDIGADKQEAYFGLAEEENPALGVRAIRICLKRPEMFKVQLRAILRASAYGDISLMLPMVTSLSEVRGAKALIEEVKEELKIEKLDFRADIPVGIMIETPAAAVISDLLAKETDFFSIGTNDLTQYTLAVDRMNEEMSGLFDPHHEAVMRLIEISVKNAHENGIWVGICGELASDTSLLERFVAMEVDELSVYPSSVLSVKAAVCEAGGKGQ